MIGITYNACFLYRFVFLSCLALWFTPIQAEEIKSPALHSSVEKPGFFKKDLNYQTTPIYKNLNLIYSESFSDFAPLLSEKIKKTDEKLKELFEIPRHQKSYLIFSSPLIQKPNAFARVWPLSSILIYPSAESSMMDQWSIFYWLSDTLIHEMTHIYQLSQNSRGDRALKWILGALSYRNSVLPELMLEGGAVFNESLYSYGGRLFSGWARALVLAQLKKGLPLKRILKTYNDPFSNMEKYLHGGYFFAYLHSLYGAKGVNQFFSKSWLFFPLEFYGLNSSLKRAFGKDLISLFEGYKKHYAPLAQNQISSTEKILLKSKISLPMNSDKNHIFFLISDKKSPPKLILINKKTGKIKKTTRNFHLGKIFYIKGKYYSSARGRTGSSSIEYSLFREGFKPLKKYNSEYIMDIYKNKYIALDTTQTLTQNSLFMNKKFYDNIHSSAIMDHEGRIYYFKQSEDRRLLYRDKQLLISFRSYYSFPVEADESGLYFIGATLYGSSLFVYREGEGIFRLSKSDRIVGARKISANRFLISEVGPSYYEYKIIETQPVWSAPVLYTYSFKKENIFEKNISVLADLFAEEESLEQKEPDVEELLEIDKLTAKEEHLKQEALKIKEYEQKDVDDMAPESLKDKAFEFEKSHPLPHQKAYNSLSYLNLRKTLFLVYTVPPFLNDLYDFKLPDTFDMDLRFKNLNFFSELQFFDPLTFNKFSLKGFIQKNQKLFTISYTYKKYRPSFVIAFNYKEAKLSKNRSKVFKHPGFLEIENLSVSNKKNLKSVYIPYRDQSLILSFEYPLIKRSFWNLSLSNSLTLGRKQFNNTDKLFSAFPLFFYQSKPWISYLNNKSQIMYEYKRKYPHSWKARSQKIVKISHDFLYVKKEYHSVKGMVHISGEIGKEWFADAKWQGKINLPFISPSKKRENTIPELGAFGNIFTNWNQAGFQLLKVLNLSYYPLKIPLDINRMAPLISLSLLSVEDLQQKKYKHFLIPSLGWETELNFLSWKNLKAGVSGKYIWDISKHFKPYPHFNFWLTGSF